MAYGAVPERLIFRGLGLSAWNLGRSAGPPIKPATCAKPNALVEDGNFIPRGAHSILRPAALLGPPLSLHREQRCQPFRPKLNIAKFLTAGTWRSIRLAATSSLTSCVLECISPARSWQPGGVSRVALRLVAMEQG